MCLICILKKKKNVKNKYVFLMIFKLKVLVLYCCFILLVIFGGYISVF